MGENIVGVMWCRNEGDLLPHTIPAALEQVDCLMIVDDDSTDNSWDVIKSFDSKLEYAVRRTDKIQPGTHERLFARQHLLEETRRRFGYKNTWVQIIESDTALLDTDVKLAIARYARDDVMVPWHMVNAVRREWTDEYDLPRIPDNMPLDEFYDGAHWMEQLACYTFRPLPSIHYTERPTPWPRGFSSHQTSDGPKGKMRKYDDTPLVIHYGFRSPTFYFNKMGGKPNRKYKDWDLSSPASVRRTVPFYNGTYNNAPTTFDSISRAGWCGSLRGDMNATNS